MRELVHQIYAKNGSGTGSNSRAEVLTMRIETAEKKLREEYERAKKMEFVRDPVAWALYQVWKKADAEPNGGADHA